MLQNGQFDPDSPPPKATFFCPVCEFRGSIAEDLVSADAGGRHDYRCPDCGTTIASRPGTPLARADRDDARPICHSD